MSLVYVPSRKKRREDLIRYLVGATLEWRLPPPLFLKIDAQLPLSSIAFQQRVHSVTLGRDHYSEVSGHLFLLARLNNSYSDPIRTQFLFLIIITHLGNPSVHKLAGRSPASTTTTTTRQLQQNGNSRIITDQPPIHHHASCEGGI